MGDGVIVRVAVAEGMGVAMLTGTLSSSPMKSGVVSLSRLVFPMDERYLFVSAMIRSGVERNHCATEVSVAPAST